MSRRIAVTGASGLLGSALCSRLRVLGDTPVPLVRRRELAVSGAVLWDPARHMVDVDALGHVDALVHLAGESLAAGRLDAKHRARAYESRVGGTRLIAETAASLSPRPRLVSTSAVGYFGDRGDEELDESSPAGSGFLAELCAAWEQAAGADAAITRFGIVLSQHGGALERMLPIFKSGLGGALGNGKQWMSFIHIDDAVSAIVTALTQDFVGAVNVVAPMPVRNSDFTHALGHALHRPAVMRVPAMALSLAAESTVARELLLASQRVHPRRLEEIGFTWRYPELDLALRSLV